MVISAVTACVNSITSQLPMSTVKSFELKVLISLLSGNSVLDASPCSRREVVEHVLGRKLKENEGREIYVKVCDYIREKYEKVAKAADLVANVLLDQVRYNKLIDMFGKNHQIEPMKKTPVRRKKAEVATA